MGSTVTTVSVFDYAQSENKKTLPDRYINIPGKQRIYLLLYCYLVSLVTYFTIVWIFVIEMSLRSKADPPDVFSCSLLYLFVCARMYRVCVCVWLVSRPVLVPCVLCVAVRLLFSFSFFQCRLFSPSTRRHEWVASRPETIIMTYTHAEYVSRDEYERTANNEQVQVSGASASDQLHEAIGASVVAAPQHPPDPPEVKEEDNNNPHVRYIVDQEEDDDLDDVVDDEELDQVFVAGAPVVTTGITGTGKGDQQLQLTDAEEQPEQQKRTAYTLQKTILGGEVEEFYKQVRHTEGLDKSGCTGCQSTSLSLH